MWLIYKIKGNTGLFQPYYTIVENSPEPAPACSPAAHFFTDRPIECLKPKAATFAYMITIISGTNRKDSMTLRVARLYQRLIADQHPDVQLISLEDKAVWDRTPDMLALEEQYLIPAERFLFVIPEYNGSFPGILKTMIDNSDIKKCWWHKKAALVGVADGRGGNLRGIDQLSNILHYLKVQVLWDKLPISRINEEIDQDGSLKRPFTAQAIEAQIHSFLNF
jgi:chromate reductase